MKLTQGSNVIELPVKAGTPAWIPQNRILMRAVSLVKANVLNADLALGTGHTALMKMRAELFEDSEFSSRTDVRDDYALSMGPKEYAAVLLSLEAMRQTADELERMAREIREKFLDNNPLIPEGGAEAALDAMGIASGLERAS